MRRLRKRFASVRVRLALWNTLAFALVLVALGGVFRVLARESLLNALDRDLKLQGMQFLSAQTFSRPLEGNTAIETKILQVAPRSHIGTEINQVVKRAKTTPQGAPNSNSPTTRAKILLRQEVPLSESGTEFQYRMMSLGQSDSIEAKPWDRVAFEEAQAGRERLTDLNQNGNRLRVLSLPLFAGSKVEGVLQIATPLGPVYRDIAGITRTLLMLLPLALLVAGAAGIVMTGYALRPVKALADAAMQLSPNQLSQRLPIRGRDEFDELALAFNQALERVELAFHERERAMEQLRRFTADASHELRTPLTTIKVNTGVVLPDVEPSQEHIHALRQIDRAADRMTALVQDLLLLARSDAGQAATDLRPVALAKVLQEVQESCVAEAQASVSLCVPDSRVQVMGDEEALYRLFRNLLDNALRYTPAEGEIRITLEDASPFAVVRVQDTGCGIDSVHLPHLGERFYRADAGRDRRRGGVGLGLAICRTIVAQHGGRLEFESVVGVGTTVSVWLPPCESAG